MDRHYRVWVLFLALGACIRAAAGQPASTRAAPATKPTTRPTPATITKPDEQAVWRKIWAYRAAVAEAALGLARQIKDLPLANEAKVGDVLTESPESERALLAWLVGVAPAKPPTHTDAGACELTLKLPEDDLVAALNEIHALHYKGRKFAGVDFRSLTRQGEIGFLRESATARAHPALVGAPPIPRKPGRGYFDRAAADAREFWQEHVTDAGRAQAEKRAREDAFRRLGDRVGDVTIDEKTRLADYVAAAGRPKADMRQFLRAGRERGIRYHGDAPVVEAEVKVALRTVYGCLKTWALAHDPSGDIRKLEHLVVAARGAAILETGIGWPDEDQLKTKDARALRALALAKTAPDWVGRSLRETGRAKGKATLDEEAIRAAERRARTALIGRMEELPVSDDVTVGRLAGSDDGRRKALLAALLNARHAAAPEQTGDGSVEVTLEMPLGPVWRLVFHWQRQPPASGE